MSNSTQLLDQLRQQQSSNTITRMMSKSPSGSNDGADPQAFNF